MAAEGNMHYKETQFGFEWGDAKVSRFFDDDKKGWVIIGLETTKHSRDKNFEIQIYITKTGKVRIYDKRGEWQQPST